MGKSRDNEVSEEWTWSKAGHKPLKISVSYEADLWMRVLAGSVTGHGSSLQPGTPLEILGEARLNIVDDVIPAVANGGELTLNIVQNSRTKGKACATVRLKGNIPSGLFLQDASGFWSN